MKTLQIDIVSDIACPWCAIGYARLEQAMQELTEELSFTVEWHAFELNPDPSGDGEPILAALSRKYGRSSGEMQANQANMMKIAAELGLNFDKLQERHTRNTFDAHRLVKWAGEQGRQTEMKKAFFDAYFGWAENIADPRCWPAVLNRSAWMARPRPGYWRRMTTARPYAPTKPATSRPGLPQCQPLSSTSNT